MIAKELPPVEVLREWFDYNPETGELRWKKDRTRKNAGKLVTYKRKDGYLIVKFNYNSLMAHRIIWKLQTGDEPEYVDHINRVRGDNRFENLRSVTCSQNAYNVDRADNTSGCSGVTWKKTINKWQAEIGVNGKRVYLGVYATKEEAITARLKAEVDRDILITR